MRTVAVHKSYARIAATRLLRLAAASAAYGPLSPVRELNLPEPVLPGEGGVRVSVGQSGICATDVALLDARIDPTITLAALPGRDRIFLGHELVGNITEAGAAVPNGLAVGDRVILDTRFQGPTCASERLDPCRACKGGNAMLCSNPDRFPTSSGVGGGWSDSFTAHHSEIYRVPESLTDDQAMLVEPFSLGVRAALKALPDPAGNALVIGTGMAGLTILQAVGALQPRAQVATVARYGHQQDLARALGAETTWSTLDITAIAAYAGAPMYRAPLGARYVMGGFDVIFDTIGSASTLNAALRLVRPGGTVVLVGIAMSRVRLDLSPIWHQEVTLTGVLAHGTEQRCGEAVSTYDLTTELLTQGRLVTDGFVTDRFILSDWPAAVERSRRRSDGVVRVVLDCGRG